MATVNNECAAVLCPFWKQNPYTETELLYGSVEVWKVTNRLKVFLLLVNLSLRKLKWAEDYRLAKIFVTATMHFDKIINVFMLYPLPTNLFWFLTFTTRQIMKEKLGQPVKDDKLQRFHFSHSISRFPAISLVMTTKTIIPWAHYTLWCHSTKGLLVKIKQPYELTQNY